MQYGAGGSESCVFGNVPQIKHTRLTGNQTGVFLIEDQFSVTGDDSAFRANCCKLCCSEFAEQRAVFGGECLQRAPTDSAATSCRGSGKPKFQKRAEEGGDVVREEWGIGRFAIVHGITADVLAAKQRFHCRGDLTGRVALYSAG